MSIWRYIFDHEFLQRLDIEDLRSKQTNLQVNAGVERRKLRLRITELEEELGEAAVILRAMKELMLEKELCSEAELEKKLSDLSEAIAAERKAASPDQTREKNLMRECTRCGRPMPRNRRECMYCGFVGEGAPVS